MARYTRIKGTELQTSSEQTATGATESQCIEACSKGQVRLLVESHRIRMTTLRVLVP